MEMQIILLYCSIFFSLITGSLFLKITSRDNWDARPPKNITSLQLPVPFVIIHHSFLPRVCNTTLQCINAMQSMQKFHQDVRKWDDIGYNFAIGGDGNIYEGRGWNRVGAHALHYNNESIGIVLIGDYTVSNPSDSMMQKTKELIQLGVDKNYIDETYTLLGHREVSNTECPGNAFYKTLKTWGHWKSSL